MKVARSARKNYRASKQSARVSAEKKIKKALCIFINRSGYSITPLLLINVCNAQRAPFKNKKQIKFRKNFAENPHFLQSGGEQRKGTLELSAERIIICLQGSALGAGISMPFLRAESPGRMGGRRCLLRSGIC